jgi:hypothetical protein
MKKLLGTLTAARIQLQTGVRCTARHAKAPWLECVTFFFLSCFLLFPCRRLSQRRRRCPPATRVRGGRATTTRPRCRPCPASASNPYPRPAPPRPFIIFLLLDLNFSIHFVIDFNHFSNQRKRRSRRRRRSRPSRSPRPSCPSRSCSPPSVPAHMSLSVVRVRWCVCGGACCVC